MDLNQYMVRTEGIFGFSRDSDTSALRKAFVHSQLVQIINGLKVLDSEPHPNKESLEIWSDLFKGIESDPELKKCGKLEPDLYVQATRLYEKYKHRNESRKNQFQNIHDKAKEEIISPEHQSTQEQTPPLPAGSHFHQPLMPWPPQGKPPPGKPPPPPPPPMKPPPPPPPPPAVKLPAPDLQTKEHPYQVNMTHHEEIIQKIAARTKRLTEGGGLLSIIKS